ncbi:DUF6880 family protein [Novosphingobium album (ex Liu et al. 2023)]|uniref:Uncharacterized protein n=1 Tax=Novosphingobium album (ex Liu et al. 2023) TaxID=3031130 RepID=A0ABT5WQ22_9SPHN|nr:DUF6880 family protein [Novosphingobium album (ex Liu et al. 2023)]MDE8652148.1 hypothetical protein [Novosphingobium album (ex Liu et al. 2023)]
MVVRGKTPRGSAKPTLENLQGLGAARLARLVLSQAEADPIFARAARMELAAKDDSGALAHEIDKRLKTIRRSRGFVEWDKVRPLAQELDQLRTSIAGPLAETAPSQAIDLMRLFLSLAAPVFERADDSSGILGNVFRQGGEDLGTLWCHAAATDPQILASDILALIESDGYGVFDELPDAASPALGREGRAALRRLVLDKQASLTGLERRRFDYAVGWLLPKLADLDDDVDAYIATVDPDRRNALLNAKVAERLIAHGRAEEALGWIDAPVEHDHNARELADLKLRALVALGRKEAAQAQRKAIFDRWLDAQALRDWLKALPDFEDFDAEQRALDAALAHEPATSALAFLIDWPDLGRAGRLVRERLDRLEARAYDVLRPSAETLAHSDPGAATLLYRRLVGRVLERASSKYYPYAARDFIAAAKLGPRIVDEPGIVSHASWVEELRKAHGRKVGFWSQVSV